jgi:TolA protein
MRGPSLQKTTLLSFALHLTVFVIAFLILRQSSHIVLPPPYTVNLVSPDVLTGSERGTMIDTGRESEETKESGKPAAPAEISKKSKKEAAKERDLIEKKIAALQQKEKMEKKISDLEEKQKRINALAKYHKIISVKASGEKGSVDSKITRPSVNKGENYSSKITDGIQPYWNLPPGIGKKGLEAIVSIRIRKDGTVIIQGIEKKSGNSLFDKSAIMALRNASPLPPPPYEMDNIEVRFHP